jgi:hypothetical protein
LPSVTLPDLTNWQIPMLPELNPASSACTSNQPDEGTDGGPTSPPGTGGNTTPPVIPPPIKPKVSKDNDAFDNPTPIPKGSTTQKDSPDPKNLNEVTVWNDAVQLGEQVGKDYKDGKQPAVGNQTKDGNARILEAKDLNDPMYQAHKHEKWKYEVTIDGKKYEIHYMVNADTGFTGHYKFTAY